MGAVHHHHGHARPLKPANLNRAFGIGVALNLTFVAVETTFGLLANSLALLADAGHNLSDVLGLVLAWGASVLARRQPTMRHTYGMRGASILAALANALLLLVAVGGIAWEAVQRLGAPAEVASGTVMAVAGVGIAVNTGTAMLFWRGHKSDLNVRGAFLHMAADAGVSLGVLLAAGLIALTGWTWLDAAVTLAIAGLILVSTWGLLREAVNLALHAVPLGVDPEAIRAHLARVEGVTEVHDLHIWGMSTTEAALTAHLVMPEGRWSDRLLCTLRQELHDEFGIEHVTLQVEVGEVSGCCELPAGLQARCEPLSLGQPHA